MLPADKRAVSRPGRQRSQRARDAIVEATVAEMARVGVRRLTVEGIAAAAGVAKTTVYRWWGSKGVLALDAFEHSLGILTEPRAVPSSGSLREDLYMLMRPIQETIEAVGPNRTWAEIIAEAQSDKALAEVIHARLIAPYREMQRPIFEAAIARGEISADVDVERVLDVLYGAYYHRLLLHHGKLDVDFFHGIVDLVMDGILLRKP